MAHPRFVAVAFPIALLFFAIAGCGGSSSSSSTTAANTTSTQPSGGGQTVKASADPNGALKFTQTSLSAKSGSLTIDMRNPPSSRTEHAIALDANAVHH